VLEIVLPCHRQYLRVNEVPKLLLKGDLFPREAKIKHA